MCDLHSTTAFQQGNQQLLMAKTGLTYKLSLGSTQHLSAYMTFMYQSYATTTQSIRKLIT